MPRDDDEPIIGSDDEALETGVLAPPTNRFFGGSASWLKRPRSLILEPAVFLVFFGRFLTGVYDRSFCSGRL